jgi:hypothetical protein
MHTRHFRASEDAVIDDSCQTCDDGSPHVTCDIVPLIAGAMALGGLGVGAYNAMRGGGQNDFRAQAPRLDPGAFGYGGTAQPEFRAQAGAIDARQAPLADYSQAEQARELSLLARGDQSDALQMYRAAAAGTGPSAAQAQLRAGIDASTAAAMASARSVQGSGAQRAAAAANALDLASAANQGAAAQAAQLRAQEMQAAMAGYGSLATNVRAGDMGLAGQDAARAQFQADQRLRSRQANDARAMGYEELGARASERSQAGSTAYQQQRAANELEAQRINAGITTGNAKAENDAWNSLATGMMAGGSSMLASGLANKGGK